MRLIPGKTKVQVELFKGILLSDIFVGAAFVGLILLVLTSTIPGKFYIAVGLLLLGTVLLVRLDAEPNYLYLLSILRFFGYRRNYERRRDDRSLISKHKNGDKEAAVEELYNEPASAPTETPERRKARIKAEKAERKADDKKLKDRKVSEEEKNAIWLKRANQSAARKRQKQQAKNGPAASFTDMEEIIAFTGIRDDFIEYGGKYYGAAIEIPPIEFRFLSKFRRTNSIDNGVGRILRALSAEYAANLVKIERIVLYDRYLENENKKLDALRASYEKGFLREDELRARVDVLYHRINDLKDLCEDNKVVMPFYYLVLFDSDRGQLNVSAQNAVDTLKTAELDAHRLDTKELAVFLKYTNQLDFDEHEIEEIDPEDYAQWAMPKKVTVRYRTVLVGDIVTHNLRTIHYPSEVNDAWLASVMSMPATKVVVKFTPLDRDKSVRSIDFSLQELRARYQSTGIDSKRIELQGHIDSLSNLLSMLQADNESLLQVNIYVTAYDIHQSCIQNDDPKLKKSSIANITGLKRSVRRLYQENNIRLGNMDFCQVEAFIGSQVSAWDPMFKKGQGMPASTVAGAYPWIFAHISDENGVKLGVSDGVPVFIDFFRRDSERVNSNMVIVGKSGSGKSYATKSILTNLAAEDSKIFILDPENEYTELARNLHGKFINVGNAQFGRLNPFHIITALDDDEETGSGISGSYATHLQFLEEFFRQILPDCEKDAMEYLNSLIDRMYTNKGITAATDLSKLGPEDYPVFDDLYDTILAEFQTTDNSYIRTMLRTLMNYIAKFSTGGRNANIWNGPSTVTTEENFTVFNFQSLLANRNGTIANAQMLLVLKYIDNEIIKNRDYNTKYRLNRKIVVVIDEAHVFIDTKFPVALDFMFQLAKRIRKYNGMQIVITQNIKDFVGSEEIARKSTAIINACQYSFIFSLAPNDMDDLCRLYEKAGGINEREQEQIISAPRGQVFTIMSAQSRSTFKVTVPKDITTMFQEQSCESRYFGGEDGERAWNEFIGESQQLHEGARIVNKISQSMADAERREARSHVTFMEITEEEAAALKQTGAKKKPSVRNAVPFAAETSATEISAAESSAMETSAAEIEEFPEIPELPEDPAEFARLRADTRRTAASEISETESGSDAAEKAAVSETKAIPERETVSKTETVFRTETVPETEGKQPTVPAEVRTAPTASSPTETERLLTELLSRFSHDAILEEVRRAVSAEIGKGVITGQPADGQPAKAVSADSNAEAVPETQNGKKETEAVDLFAGTAMDTAAGTETETPAFDIMAMLSMEAEKMGDISPIDMMETYGETVITVTLEELAQYNSKH